MNFIKKHWPYFALIPLGALGGFLYWHQIGCANGQCAMKSNPYYMTGYGSLIGIFLGGVFSDIKNRKKKD